MQCVWVPSQYSDLPEEYVDSVGTAEDCLPGAWHNIYMHVGPECLGHAGGSAHLVTRAQTAFQEQWPNYYNFG